LLTEEELRSGLRQFTQIDGWYHHWLNRFVYSDGVKWLSDQGDCRWLLTDIAFYQLRIKSDYPQFEPFQIWHFKSVSANHVALKCLDGNSQTPFIQDEVEVLQCAFTEITLWLVNGMLLLPSEYCGVQVRSEMNA